MRCHTGSGDLDFFLDLNGSAIHGFIVGHTLWLCQNSYGKIHHFSWENPLFLWPFSIVMLVYQRVIPSLSFPNGFFGQGFVKKIVPVNCTLQTSDWCLEAS